ncbi:MAG: GNAT family N-acetyltransferase [Candidatus Thorarchaeota archaeon]
MSSFKIRLANSSDASSISNLYSEVWSEYADRFPDELLRSRTPSPGETLLWLETDTYFVAVTEDELVGVVGCISKHGTLYLTHMVVKVGHRRQGIGQALVETVIETARKRKAKKVWLNTVPFLTEAISLYKKNGFKRCAYMRKHLWGLDVELYELILE